MFSLFVPSISLHFLIFPSTSYQSLLGTIRNEPTVFKKPCRHHSQKSRVYQIVYQHFLQVPRTCFDLSLTVVEASDKTKIINFKRSPTLFVDRIAKHYKFQINIFRILKTLCKFWIYWESSMNFKIARAAAENPPKNPKWSKTLYKWLLVRIPDVF